MAKMGHCGWVTLLGGYQKVPSTNFSIVFGSFAKVNPGWNAFDRP